MNTAHIRLSIVKETIENILYSPYSVLCIFYSHQIYEVLSWVLCEISNSNFLVDELVNQFKLLLSIARKYVDWIYTATWEKKLFDCTENYILELIQLLDTLSLNKSYKFSCKRWIKFSKSFLFVTKLQEQETKKTYFNNFKAVSFMSCICIIHLHYNLRLWYYVNGTFSW